MIKVVFEFYNHIDISKKTILSKTQLYFILYNSNSKIKLLKNPQYKQVLCQCFLDITIKTR